MSFLMPHQAGASRQYHRQKNRRSHKAEKMNQEVKSGHENDTDQVFEL